MSGQSASEWCHCHLLLLSRSELRLEPCWIVVLMLTWGTNSGGTSLLYEGKGAENETKQKQTRLPSYFPP
jgi:hypothetical protein